MGASTFCFSASGYVIGPPFTNLEARTCHSDNSTKGTPHNSRIQLYNQQQNIIANKTYLVQIRFRFCLNKFVLKVPPKNRCIYHNTSFKSQPNSISTKQGGFANEGIALTVA